MHFQIVSAWIGYLEHKSPERLWNFTENTGKGGCTIFAEMLLHEQNRDLQGLPWCVTFVHAVFNRPDVLGRAHPGCKVLVRRMKRRGLWREGDYRPQENDLIFCSNGANGCVDHVGIVEQADETTVTSIDGNTADPTGVFPPQDGGAVARRIRDRKDPHIVGFAATGALLSEKQRDSKGRGRFFAALKTRNGRKRQ